jgi:beta-lactamase class A
MFIFKKNKWFKKFFWVTVIVTIIVFFIYKNFNDENKRILSPVPDKIEENPITFIQKIIKPQKTPKELKNQIQNYIGDKWQNYSIYVKDLNSDFEMKIGESIIYDAASINKIPILAALYYLHQSKKINLDENITIQAKDIQDYGTGSIRYETPGSVYSVKTLAKLMIEQSDNTAAYILANYTIGIDQIQSLVDNWGMTQTDMIDNKTSNSDTEIIFEKIYSGNIANAADTKEMLSYLSNTELNTRIPAKLPEKATIYHKIGTGVSQIHDAGIIKSDDKSYYIGIFTADTTEGDETDNLISQVSKIVYDYMIN